MNFDRKSQAEIARHVLEIDQISSNPKVTRELYFVAAAILKQAGFEDNGIAFDLSEYLYEKMRRIEQKQKDDGWEKYAYNSLIAQLEDEE